MAYRTPAGFEQFRILFPAHYALFGEKAPLPGFCVCHFAPWGCEKGTAEVKDLTHVKDRQAIPLACRGACLFGF